MIYIIRRKRFIVIFVATVIVGCLYFTKPHVYSAIAERNFNCESLGTSMFLEHYNTSKEPDGSQRSEFYDRILAKYGNDHENAEDQEIVKFVNDEIQGWQRACDVARDSRKTRINMTLVITAIIYFSLPKDSRKKKNNEIDIDEDATQ